MADEEAVANGGCVERIGITFVGFNSEAMDRRDKAAEVWVDDGLGLERTEVNEGVESGCEGMPVSINRRGGLGVRIF